MASARVFQVALVDRVYPAVDYFTPHVKNVITYGIFDHLMKIVRSTTDKFIPGPGWSYKPALVQSHDVVIYFVLDSSSSLARKKLGIEPTTRDGGFTVSNGSVTLSEVYVEGAMPAERLANVAFHELMHNKLQVGNSMHDMGGLATSPTHEGLQLNAENIRRLSPRMFRSVPQYTKGMID